MTFPKVKSLLQIRQPSNYLAGRENIPSSRYSTPSNHTACCRLYLSRPWTVTRIRHLPNVEEHLATIRPRPPRGSHHPPIYTRARALVLRLTLPVTNCLCDAQAQVAYEGGLDHGT